LKNKKITIVDYRMGNLGSIRNMLSYLGFESKISNRIEDINEADFLVLPGVGKFDSAMKNIKNLKLDDILKENVLEKKTPILGICLGMQIMCLSSEEGNQKGLGFIDYEVKKFKFSKESNLKVPHMGWNYLSKTSDGILLKKLVENPRFYFVHSYYVEDSELPFKSSLSEYGRNFVSSFEKNNIFGVQFHPEKSHKFGKELFKNFLNYHEEIL
tara:strand:+ start:130 stop:768 length:639 start_codon:yes stop_codon:yes gene_type:complete